MKRIHLPALACGLAMLAIAAPSHAAGKGPCQQASQTANVKKVCALFKKWADLSQGAAAIKDQPDWVKADLGYLASKLVRPENATVDKVTWAGSAANYK